MTAGGNPSDERALPDASVPSPDFKLAKAFSVGIVGRDPVGKTVTELMIAAHPDWTDEQISDRINREYTEPVIDAAEVAHWREAAR